MTATPAASAAATGTIPSRGQVKPNVTAQAIENDIAKVDVACVANHQVEIAGKYDGNGDEDEILAQSRVTSRRRQNGKQQCDAQNYPEGRPLQHQAAFPNIPRGNATRTIMKRPNSIKGIQLTAMKGVTAPSSSPSSMPATSAPIGLPSRPAR